MGGVDKKNRDKIWPQLRVVAQERQGWGAGRAGWPRRLGGAPASRRGGAGPTRKGVGTGRGRRAGGSGGWRWVELPLEAAPAWPRGSPRPIAPEPSGPVEPARSRLLGEGGQGAGTRQAAAGAVSLSLSRARRRARRRAEERRRPLGRYARGWPGRAPSLRRRPRRPRHLPRRALEPEPLGGGAGVRGSGSALGGGPAGPRQLVRSRGLGASGPGAPAEHLLSGGRA